MFVGFLYLECEEGGLIGCGGGGGWFGGGDAAVFDHPDGGEVAPA